MLITPIVTNRLLLYSSFITNIFIHFKVPLSEPIYMETKKLEGEAIIEISFHRRNGEWVKMTLSKKYDTLVALEDDRVHNDVYPTDQLPNFILRARPQVPR